MPASHHQQDSLLHTLKSTADRQLQCCDIICCMCASLAAHLGAIGKLGSCMSTMQLFDTGIMPCQAHCELLRTYTVHTSFVTMLNNMQGGTHSKSSLRVDKPVAYSRATAAGSRGTSTQGSRGGKPSGFDTGADQTGRLALGCRTVGPVHALFSHPGKIIC